MSQRTFKETECRPELVPEHTGLLCDICTSKVVSVLGVARRAS